MTRFKSFAIALAIMIGTSTFANSESVLKTKNVDKAEINNLLQGKFLALHTDLYAKVVFTLDENNRIEVNTVATTSHFMRNYITKRLEDKKLTGEEWEAGKTYILPVRILVER